MRVTPLGRLHLYRHVADDRADPIATLTVHGKAHDRIRNPTPVRSERFIPAATGRAHLAPAGRLQILRRRSRSAHPLKG